MRLNQCIFSAALKRARLFFPAFVMDQNKLPFAIALLANIWHIVSALVLATSTPAPVLNGVASPSSRRLARRELLPSVTLRNSNYACYWRVGLPVTTLKHAFRDMAAGP